MPLSMRHAEMMPLVATQSSIRLFANLLPSTLSRPRLLHPALRTRLQIKGMALHFLNDVFHLNLAPESTGGVVD
jgi:hypothetical protein